MKYFTFEIDGQKVGYYEERDEEGIIFCNAHLVINGQLEENPFWIKYNDALVLAYKVGNGEWVDFDQPPDVYPGSAIKVILKKMGSRKTMTYQHFHERSGQVTANMTLIRRGNRVEEYSGEDLKRYFVLEAGQIIEYGWGGTAKSVLVRNLEEAKIGTPFE
ncbi:MAG: hypothetical protein QNJ45_05545 [Ardenticatenaceae bacterium]|nr:hypothetical protein [Ardenticatenaceae bacterium]